MESIGIVAEYNPFHNGHLHHLAQSRNISKIHNTICVMSGNFTQRGDVALMDKWTRAAMAVEGGVDLVIELPTVFAVRSAQDFAAGALRLLDALGIVRVLCFGAEHAEYSLLKEIASSSTDPETISFLHQHLKAGKSYAAALSNAILKKHPHAGPILIEPNNILGIEYIKAIERFSCKFEPVPVQRISAHYHATEISATITSATAIRTQLNNPASADVSALKAALPPCTYAVISKLLSQEYACPSLHYLAPAILAQLRTMKLSELAALPGISEGLEHKLSNAAVKGTCIDELLSKTKSKRYPQSRLQRVLLHCLLRTDQRVIAQFDASGPLYARILAFNRNGRSMLKSLKSSSRLPLITKTAEYLTTASRGKDQLSPLEKMLTIDTYATDLYSLCFTEAKKGGLDFIQSPIYLDIE